ncbi:MAG TPA: glycoside hydrolase family 3 N-terminal domain-containing protein [Gemmatimonadaceae bacterium]|nr:glycoside hydrolase family 3 N-terminal domain-containing protein [Gemmatimonadaceae bacterium]
MNRVAQLLLPAIGWDPHRGYDAAQEGIGRALALGVGGFVLHGGEQDAVRALAKQLRHRSSVPLLIGAELERGAGQQFAGATGLPPLAAIAALNDVDALRRAARLTAREARTLGVNWAYAPVVDLDLLPDNAVTGSRSLGADPQRVGALASEWVDACQSEGVLACAKHFPGHGRAGAHSRTPVPVVNASKQELMDTDLVPFRSAIAAGVASIMTAHVAYPALDPSGAPATTSREMLRWLLRQQLNFDRLIVSDALALDAPSGAEEDEGALAVRALNAGCDLLLCPRDVAGVARALERALHARELDADRVNRSVRRRLKWAQWASPPNEYRKPSATDVVWGAQLADRVVHMVRGMPPRLHSPLDVLVVDDDEDGAIPVPAREPFLTALREAGWAVRPVQAPTNEPGRSLVIALFGEVHSWKGRAGYSLATRNAVEWACAAAPGALVVQFGPPRLVAEIPFARAVLSTWGGDSAMQQAAARWLVRER